MKARSLTTILLGADSPAPVLKFKGIAAVWIVVGICLTLCGCGLERTVGGTGSETTNTIRVAVVGIDGQAVAGARVLARPESDTTESGAQVFVTDDDGRVDLPTSAGPVWLEARGIRDAALDVVSAGFAGTRRVVLQPVSGLRLEGLRPGQIVSLPGLGRTAIAGGDGVVQFASLPSGVGRAKWAGFDGPVPLPVGGEGEVIATESVISMDWPSDGSLDSLAIRRFLDRAGIGSVPVEAVATPLKGRLARLDLARQNLDSIPSSIGVLAFLREVVLRGNRLRTLPSTFASLRDLDVLDLGANPLDSVPAALRWIDSLRILELDSAGLETVPGWIGNLGRLWYLGLGWNRLDSLPESLTSLKRLEILGIFQNRISEFPVGMGAMDSLGQIWAETNRLRALPSDFVRLPSLKTLQLDNNPLDSLPSDLGSLASLRDLRLTGTSLRTLPASLARLPLQTLQVHGLTLCTIDPSLEPKLDSLAGPDWRSARSNGCP